MPEDSRLDTVSKPETDETSESEEMYLITVARAAEEGRPGRIPVAEIARMLSVSVASAHQMVRKLVNRGLLTYEPYHGVELTQSGHQIADRVLRIRRLWATFLVQHLEFTPADADAQACHLEHVTSLAAAERLSAFLGNPRAGPLGRPIPASGDGHTHFQNPRLADLEVGDWGKVTAVNASDGSQRFLATEGIAPGTRVKVAAIGSSGLLLDVEGSRAHLGYELAHSIEVEVQRQR